MDWSERQLLEFLRTERGARDVAKAFEVSTYRAHVKLGALVKAGAVQRRETVGGDLRFRATP